MGGGRSARGGAPGRGPVFGFINLILALSMLVVHSGRLGGGPDPGGELAPAGRSRSRERAGGGGRLLGGQREGVWALLVLSLGAGSPGWGKLRTPGPEPQAAKGQGGVWAWGRKG